MYTLKTTNGLYFYFVFLPDTNRTLT